METNSKVTVDQNDHQNDDRPNIKGDRINFILLTFLYLLNSIVGGIAVAIPYVLQTNLVTYEDQAEFNVIWYPASVKILWAPIVDSIYCKRMGRRKSWLLTSQYFTGALLWYISMNIDDWLGSEDGQKKANVRLLTVTFSLCSFFGSLQDIALDGWSLTIFQKKNVSYAGVCQSLGCSIGFGLISTGFIVLNSKDFCNTFRSVPQDYGFISFSNFVFFWSMTLIVSNTLILLFKKETADDERSDVTKVDDRERKLGIIRTYALLWKILRIPQMQMVCFFLLTRHIVNGPIFSVAPLKLLDSGVTQDTLALLNVFMLPIQLFSLFFLSHYVTGRRPLRVFLLFYVLRLINGIIYAFFVFIVSYWKAKDNALPTWHYWPLISVLTVENVGFLAMMMATSATFAGISDARFGGVYMTLLNSINNIGSSWPSTICLWFVNWLTIRSCSVDETTKGIFDSVLRAATATCGLGRSFSIICSGLLVTNTEISEGHCSTIIDGFYVEMFVFSLVGVLWIFWAKKQINNLEKTNASAFIVKKSSTAAKDFIVDEKSLPLVVN